MGDSSSSDVIGVAVIGIGRIGKVHVSNLLRMPKVNLLYIVDVCKEYAVKYIEEFGLTTTPLHTDEVDVALEDKRVNAVIVCCPSQMHEVHTKAALGKGKAVMCEKPLSLSLDAIVECYQLAEERKRPLFCAFNKRFDPQVASMKSQLPETIGRLKAIKAVSRDHPMNSFEYLKISGGYVLDSAVHEIDLVNWISGMIPETVYAIGHAHFSEIREMGDVDQLFLTMKFADGLMAHIDMNRDSKFGHDQRIEVRLFRTYSEIKAPEWHGMTSRSHLSIHDFAVELDVCTPACSDKFAFLDRILINPMRQVVAFFECPSPHSPATGLNVMGRFNSFLTELLFELKLSSHNL